MEDPLYIKPNFHFSFYINKINFDERNYTFISLMPLSFIILSIKIAAMYAFSYNLWSYTSLGFE